MAERIGKSRLALIKAKEDYLEAVRGGCSKTQEERLKILNELEIKHGKLLKTISGK